MRGYERQLCVDFSSAVVSLMRDRHAETAGIEWRLMDVRDMKGLNDASIDVAFDKGTFDAMIYGSPWSPPQEVRDNTAAYLREVRYPLSCFVFFPCFLSFPFLFLLPFFPLYVYMCSSFYSSLLYAPLLTLAACVIKGPQGPQRHRPISVCDISATAFHEAIVESGRIVGHGHAGP